MDSQLAVLVSIFQEYKEEPRQYKNVVTIKMLRWLNMLLGPSSHNPKRVPRFPHSYLLANALLALCKA